MPDDNGVNIAYEFQMRKWLIRSFMPHTVSLHILNFILPPACQRRCTINGNLIPARKLQYCPQRDTGRIKGG